MDGIDSSGDKALRDSLGASRSQLRQARESLRTSEGRLSDPLGHEKSPSKRRSPKKVGPWGELSAYLAEKLPMETVAYKPKRLYFHPHVPKQGTYPRPDKGLEEIRKIEQEMIKVKTLTLTLTLNRNPKRITREPVSRNRI